MNKQKLKCGDVVLLKSGGSLMTVRNANSAGDIQCEWFLDNKTTKVDTFKQDQLEIHDTATNKETT